MKENLTEMVFILDRSGSMSGLENDTIGGYNSLIEKQKQLTGDCLVTTVLFDDQYEVIHDRKDLHSISFLTNTEYYVRGWTALLDAVGKTILNIGKQLSEMKEEERPSKVMVVIITDGYENSSREFTYEQVRQMITHQKEVYKWEFLFLGANIEAKNAAKTIGIDKDRAVDYCPDSTGTKKVYSGVNMAMASMRMESVVNDSWKNEIDEDFRRRGKKKQSNNVQ